MATLPDTHGTLSQLVTADALQFGSFLTSPLFLSWCYDKKAIEFRAQHKPTQHTLRQAAIICIINQAPAEFVYPLAWLIGYNRTVTSAAFTQFNGAPITANFTHALGHTTSQCGRGKPVRHFMAGGSFCSPRTSQGLEHCDVVLMRCRFTLAYIQTSVRMSLNGLPQSIQNAYPLGLRVTHEPNPYGVNRLQIDTLSHISSDPRLTPIFNGVTFLRRTAAYTYATSLPHLSSPQNQSPLAKADLSALSILVAGVFASGSSRFANDAIARNFNVFTKWFAAYAGEYDKCPTKSSGVTDLAPTTKFRWATDTGLPSLWCVPFVASYRNTFRTDVWFSPNGRAELGAQKERLNVFDTQTLALWYNHASGLPSMQTHRNDTTIETKLQPMVKYANTTQAIHAMPPQVSAYLLHLTGEYGVFFCNVNTDPLDNTYNPSGDPALTSILTQRLGGDRYDAAYLASNTHQTTPAHFKGPILPLLDTATMVPARHSPRHINHTWYGFSMSASAAPAEALQALLPHDRETTFSGGIPESMLRGFEAVGEYACWFLLSKPKNHMAPPLYETRTVQPLDENGEPYGSLRTEHTLTRMGYENRAVAYNLLASVSAHHQPRLRHFIIYERTHLASNITGVVPSFVMTKTSRTNDMAERPAYDTLADFSRSMDVIPVPSTTAMRKSKGTAHWCDFLQFVKTDALLNRAQTTTGTFTSPQTTTGTFTSPQTTTGAPKPPVSSPQLRTIAPNTSGAATLSPSHTNATESILDDSWLDGAVITPIEPSPSPAPNPLYMVPTPTQTTTATPQPVQPPKQATAQSTSAQTTVPQPTQPQTATIDPDEVLARRKRAIFLGLVATEAYQQAPFEQQQQMLADAMASLEPQG